MSWTRYYCECRCRSAYYLTNRRYFFCICSPFFFQLAHWQGQALFVVGFEKKERKIQPISSPFPPHVSMSSAYVWICMLKYAACTVKTCGQAYVGCMCMCVCAFVCVNTLNVYDHSLSAIQGQRHGYRPCGERGGGGRGEGVAVPELARLCRQCFVSGSAWIRIQLVTWIRIRIPNADPDPGAI
jgi:hypothetical protein